MRKIYIRFEEDISMLVNSDNIFIESYSVENGLYGNMKFRIPIEVNHENDLHIIRSILNKSVGLYESGNVLFFGFVNSVDLVLDGLTVKISLDNVYNKIKVQYNNGETDYATNDDSIDELGELLGIFFVSTDEESVALANRSNLLRNKSELNIEHDIDSISLYDDDSSESSYLLVECLGNSNRLRHQFYKNSDYYYEVNRSLAGSDDNDSVNVSLGYNLTESVWQDFNMPNEDTINQLYSSVYDTNAFGNMPTNSLIHLTSSYKPVNDGFYLMKSVSKDGKEIKVEPASLDDYDSARSTTVQPATTEIWFPFRYPSDFDSYLRSIELPITVKGDLNGVLFCQVFAADFSQQNNIGTYLTQSYPLDVVNNDFSKDTLFTFYDNILLNSYQYYFFRIQMQSSLNTDTQCSFAIMLHNQNLHGVECTVTMFNGSIINMSSGFNSGLYLNYLPEFTVRTVRSTEYILDQLLDEQNLWAEYDILKNETSYLSNKLVYHVPEYTNMRELILGILDIFSEESIIYIEEHHNTININKSDFDHLFTIRINRDNRNGVVNREIVNNFGDDVRLSHLKCNVSVKIYYNSIFIDTVRVSSYQVTFDENGNANIDFDNLSNNKQIVYRI